VAVPDEPASSTPSAGTGPVAASAREPAARARSDGDDAPVVGTAPSAAPPTTLGLVGALCRELEAEGVSFCHWKSNEALDRSATAENDLDLLVARADAQRFEEVLRRLGFRNARVARMKELPGVFHAYGVDAPSGRFVHVHAHYQLVIGDDMTKNYRLPVELPYLASVVRAGVFPIPSAEWELVVFVVRMMLKHASWDAVAMLQGSLSASERRELADLTSRADLATARRIVDEHLPFIGVRLFDRCLAAVRGDGSVTARARTAARLLDALSACARRPRAADVTLKVWRRGVLGTRRYVLHRRTRKSLEGGGVLVAIVGGDGSGKSSVVESLSRWLGDVFVTERVHLGKPPRSMATLALKGAMSIGRRMGRFPETAVPAHAQRTDAAADCPGTAWLLWHALTARDRAREYGRARRLATNGAIVIADRYPVPELRWMEAPRAAWLSGRALRGMPRALIAYEGRCYDRIAEPDVLVVLRAHPDVAVARRPDQDEAFVRARSEEVWAADWSGGRAAVVDADRQREHVLAEVRSLVWSRI
jgi:thymidylate kinase